MLTKSKGCLSTMQLVILGFLRSIEEEMELWLLHSIHMEPCLIFAANVGHFLSPNPQK